ncbi:NADH-quinone oxidoreductase subunit K [Ramlibacter sp. AW1]|uniref:NADH-quinone oxidoreductase subunit K n=1 Tax=Ramlibacter aurantiacus TaxID=2801330 RepID=A0A936ZM97_9BURK|nr:NADH-quinone oxidoreductase subunit K [Ramlibacter aurantiacus]MBL0420286.1 NADH-quinone oxidoreductase subunit K [Ramlibacter aurantiacus]
MSTATVFGLAGAALIAIGVYGLMVRMHLLRLVIGFNMVGSGIFLLFGSLASRGPQAMPDPVPLAMVITGIVVSLAASALALALAVRLHEDTGATRLPEEDGDAAVDH